MAELAFGQADMVGARVLDPAVGPGTFPLAIASTQQPSSWASITAYDLDPAMIKTAGGNLANAGGLIELDTRDYLTSDIEEPFDLVIMNPPYVRQEAIPQPLKDEYSRRLLEFYGEPPPARANLYCYFLLKGLMDTRVGGFMCAVVLDSLDGTKYGTLTRRLLDRHSDTLSLETLETPFPEVLADAEVLLLKRRHPSNLPSRSSASHRENLIELGHLVDARRGRALINNRVFMASPEDTYYRASSSFVRRSRLVPGHVVTDSHPERAYLIPGEEAEQDGLVKWLAERVTRVTAAETGKGAAVVQARVKERPKTWYVHEPLSAPILFNYFLRNGPRHLLNPNAIPASDNFYLIQPHATDVLTAWMLLNTPAFARGLLEASRNAGAGLRKLQLYEYKSAIVPDWRTLSRSTLDLARHLGEQARHGTLAVETAAVELARADSRLA
jgi:hypothetical protein